MTKSELRKTFQEKRKSLSAHDSAELNRKIVEQFFDTCDLAEVETLHCYIPIAKFNEVDTRSILEKVWGQFRQIQTVAPRINLETGELQCFAFNAETKFVENAWGVSEPASGDPIDPIDLDLVLVPLLCFDRLGNRVGYGKGFYDKFLAKCKLESQKVGLSFFLPVERIDDVDTFDIPLDKCVTPEEVFTFNQ